MIQYRDGQLTIIVGPSSLNLYLCLWFNRDWLIVDHWQIGQMFNCKQFVLVELVTQLNWQGAARLKENCVCSQILKMMSGRGCSVALYPSLPLNTLEMTLARRTWGQSHSKELKIIILSLYHPLGGFELGSFWIFRLVWFPSLWLWLLYWQLTEWQTRQDNARTWVRYIFMRGYMRSEIRILIDLEVKAHQRQWPLKFK